MHFGYLSETIQDERIWLVRNTWTKKHLPRRKIGNFRIWALCHVYYLLTSCHAMAGAFRVTTRMTGCSRKSLGLFQAFRSYGRRKQMCAEKIEQRAFHFRASLETSQPLYIKKARALFDQSAERSNSKESKTLFTRSRAVQFPRRAKILWEGSNAIVLNSFGLSLKIYLNQIFSFLDFL